MDDEEIVREVCRKMLEKIGCRVMTSCGGEEALLAYHTMMGSDPFDAVILDLTIPEGVGGKDTMENLLKIDPRARGIVSSGYSDDPVISHYEEYGFKAVMKKPYNLIEMVEILKNVIEG